MDRARLDDLVDEFIEENVVPSFNLGVMSEVLLDELEFNWNKLPEQTQSVVLAVAAGLKKLHVDELNSDKEARALVKKLRNE